MPAGLNDLWPTAIEKPSVSRRFSMIFLEDVIGAAVMTELGGGWWLTFLAENVNDGYVVGVQGERSGWC